MERRLDRIQVALTLLSGRGIAAPLPKPFGPSPTMTAEDVNPSIAARSGTKANRARKAVSTRASNARYALFWSMPTIIWQVTFFLVPLGFLLAMTFWSVRNFRLAPDFVLANWAHIFSANFFLSAYVYTFSIALLTAVLASLLAFPVAYTMTFKVGAAARRLMIFMLIVPFFTSYPVRIYSWQIFFSPSGIINHLLTALSIDPIAVLNTTTGTVIGYLTLTMPLVVLLQTFAMTNVDKRLLEAAENLGCSRHRAIVTVLIPSARVGLVLAATFAFILSFGDYISPLLLGGSNPPTLSILIADQVKSGNHWPRASVVAVTMIVTLIIVLLSMLTLAYPPRRKSR